jgi:hypothetical protein
MIAAERKRQMSVEGWTPEHDDEHGGDQLSIAAGCYTMAGWHEDSICPNMWPWEADAWKPKDRIRNLVRAGALIAAEIDRLQRLRAIMAMEDGK